MLGYIHTEETKKKISNSLIGKNNPNWGKKLSKETKEKIGNGNRGKLISKETREKLSNTKKGVKIHTDEWKKRNSERMIGNSYNKGNKHSDETKKIISMKDKGKNKGRIVSIETRNKISKSHIGKEGNTNRRVIIEGVEYKSITESAIILNKNITTILYRLNSRSDRFDQYQFI